MSPSDPTAARAATASDYDAPDRGHPGARPSPVERRVVEIVSRITRVPAQRIATATDLRADLNVDSLQGLQIVAAIENEFGLIVPPEEMDMYSSVGRIVSTIEEITARTAGPQRID